ncbi:MAG TPA: extracellular solute-binding protein [Candidatus Limnocylindria bacterium]|nr:extracellular solute-binding protein [Candidatus Limnocylindria bacterium]
MRRTAIAQVALLGGVIAAACGAPPTGSVSSPSTKPAKVVIRTFAGQAIVDMMEKHLLPGYKQKAPHHTVEWEQQTTGSGAAMIEAVTAAGAAGTPPDVFYIGSDWIAQLARSRMIKDLTAYIKAWGQDREYYANTVEALWGRRWFLPQIASCDLYLYRIDWFREANLPTEQAGFPVSWEAFADAATRLTRRQGDEFTRAGFYTTGEVREWRQLLWQAGGEEWNADHTRATYNSQAGVDALTYLRDLLVRYQVAPPGGMPIPSGNNAISAGLAAMQRLTPSGANTVLVRAPDVFAQIGYGPPHKRDKQVNQIDVDGWAMTAAAREPEAGFALLAFIEEPNNLLAWNEAVGLIPPRKALATSTHVQQPYIRAFQELLEKYGRGYQQYQTAILNTAAADAVQGHKSVKQALDDAVRENDAFLATLQPIPR